MTFRKHFTERHPAVHSEEFTEQAAGIGALADPLRRELYNFIAAQDDAVGREAAATALDIPVHTARTHLDRLVKEGLLEVEFRRLSGRTGPGAGRPAKLYRRSNREFAVSLPERRYDLVGHILATAIDHAKTDGMPAAETMDGIAYEEGRRFGAEVDPAGEDDLDRVAQVLSRLGYEPQRDGDTLSLRNCPFDTLAKQHTDLVCGLNVSYVQGVSDAIEASGCEAVLEPEPGMCCVKIRLR